MESKKKYKCTFEGCNITFLRPSRLLWHIRQHTGEKPYKCSFKNCDKAYTNSSHLKRHMSQHSQKSEFYKCPICSLNIKSIDNLKRHCKVVHNENRLACKHCSKVFRKENLLKEHLHSHGESPFIYKCSLCNMSFTCHRKFNRHQLSHDVSTLKCALCKTSYDKRQQYHEHLKTVHKDDHVCKNCKKFFILTNRLKKHNCKNNEDTFSCPYDNCTKMYYCNKNLNTHIKITHEGFRYICDNCKLEFKHKDNMKHHIISIHLNSSEEVTQKKPKKLIVRNRRKDLGTTKKSIISKLIGVEFPPDIEKQLLNRHVQSN